MKGNQEIYQKTDVEHVFDGLAETPRIQYEVEIVQRSSSVPFELADQTIKGLRDQFLGSILRAGVAPVLVDVQGAGLPQSRVGLPGSIDNFCRILAAYSSNLKLLTLEVIWWPCSRIMTDIL